MEEHQSFRYKILNSEFLIFTISLAIMVVLFALFYFKLPDQIPLFYSRPTSDRQITDLFVIFLIPLVQFVSLVINTTLRKKFYNENEFIGKIFYLFNIIIIVLGLYIFVTIIFLVT